MPRRRRCRAGTCWCLPRGTDIKRTLPLLLAGALLAGCAGLRSLGSDVSTYGDWPVGRAPSTYAFERLPSQQAQPAQTARVENAARAALAKAGFREADGAVTPAVLVQVGARTTRTELRLWDDPLWWRGGFAARRHGPWPGAPWLLSTRWETSPQEHEVALLLRDTASGKPLFEARARSDEAAADDAHLAAMFEAALADFPRLGINPRRVVVKLPG